MNSTFNMLLIADTIALIEARESEKAKSSMIFNNLNECIVALALLNAYSDYELLEHEFEFVNDVYCNPLNYAHIPDLFAIISKKNREFLHSDSCFVVSYEYENYTSNLTKLYEGAIEIIEDNIWLA